MESWVWSLFSQEGSHLLQVQEALIPEKGRDYRLAKVGMMQIFELRVSRSEEIIVASEAIVGQLPSMESFLISSGEGFELLLKLLGAHSWEDVVLLIFALRVYVALRLGLRLHAS
jgi:hypothetical protein